MAECESEWAVLAVGPDGADLREGKSQMRSCDAFSVRADLS